MFGIKIPYFKLARPLFSEVARRGVNEKCSAACLDWFLMMWLFEIHFNHPKGHGFILSGLL